MEAAVRELLLLEPEGLQLTPGNAPTPGFETFIKSLSLPVSSHHGYCTRALRQRVWSEQGQCLVPADSVHPPKRNAACANVWWANFREGKYRELCLETMYPGYFLGSNAELTLAMDLGQRLAVDVSHLHIGRVTGDLSQSTLERLLTYEAVCEVHMSANNGRYDKHWQIENDTFGLDWCREKLREGTPVVLECYMHKLTMQERLKQMSFLRL
jgi:hypothetical protein